MKRCRTGGPKCRLRGFRGASGEDTRVGFFFGSDNRVYRPRETIGGWGLRERKFLDEKLTPGVRLRMDVRRGSTRKR